MSSMARVAEEIVHFSLAAVAMNAVAGPVTMDHTDPFALLNLQTACSKVCCRKEVGNHACQTANAQYLKGPMLPSNAGSS